jgi:prevent-host-death family protein
MKRAGHSERTVGAFEAKTNLSRYLADAEKGIVTIVTVRGRPAAKIVPVGMQMAASGSNATELIERARALRRRARRGPVALRELVNAGRR